MPASQNKKRFNWTGLNQRGKKQTGTILARNIASAKMELSRRGVVVRKINQPSTLLQSLTKQKIKPIDIATFSRQLSTMITAGIPLVKSLSVVSKSLKNPTFAELINQIKTEIEHGSTFADALAQHPNQFDNLFCRLVDAGEQSGTLDTMLERIATYKEKSESIKKKIRKALSYPVAVILVSLIVTTILLVKVIPKFETLFANVGSELPAFTQLVINLSESFQKIWWMLFLGLGGLVFGSIFGKKRSRKFAKFLDKLMLLLPIFGNIIKKACIARFCRTLSTTFTAGMPLVNALNVSAKATGNLVFEDKILEIAEKVSHGYAFNQAIVESKVFPPMMVQMALIGEESGELDSMMDKTAAIYEEDVDNTVDGLSSLIEPVIMSILGVLVGGLIIAMYLPIFKMGQNI